MEAFSELPYKCNEQKSSSLQTKSLGLRVVLILLELEYESISQIEMHWWMYIHDRIGW